MRHLPEITGMRGLAAFAVLLLHALVIYSFVRPTPEWGGALEFGWIGVDFFFVLSGFLLARPLLAAPRGMRAPGFWRTYMAKRWWRIAPPYYASILVALALAGDLSYIARETGDIFLHLTYLHSWRMESISSIVPVYWTLASEFQFYLLLPVFVFLLTRRSWPITLALFAVTTLVWRAMTYHGPGAPSWLSFTLPAFLLHFAFGILAARAHVNGWRSRLPAHANVALATGLFIVAPLMILGAPGSYTQGNSDLLSNVVLRPLLALGFATLILAISSEPNVLRRACSAPSMQKLGDSSYSLYLIHVPIMALLSKWPTLADAGFAAYLVVSVVASVAAGFVFYGLVEKPSLALRGWIVERRSTPRVTTPAPVEAPRPVASTPMLAQPQPTA